MNRVQGFDTGFDYDAELRRYHERLRVAIDVHPGTTSSMSAAARA
jgi:hypothetical protein